MLRLRLQSARRFSVFCQCNFVSRLSLEIQTRTKCMAKLQTTVGCLKANLQARLKKANLQKPENVDAQIFECRPYLQNVLYVIHQTRETVFHRDNQTPRTELKIRRTAEYF